MLVYHNDDTSPEQLSSQVYLPERKGSLQIEMAATARRHGMLARISHRMNELSLVI